MAVVAIKVGGRDYQVACDDGEEEHLQSLAYELDDRVLSITQRMKNGPGEAMGLLLAGLMMADEIVENKKEIDIITAEANKALARASVKRAPDSDARLLEMESAMAVTLDEIAQRLEKIAEQIEV